MKFSKTLRRWSLGVAAVGFVAVAASSTATAADLVMWERSGGTGL